MSFLTEPEPQRGAVLPIAPGIARIVAPNPGPMTYHGTNTYLLDAEDGFSIVDPGPDSAAHLAAVLAATGGRIARIVLSHTHPDHVDGLPALQAATGAPVYGWHTPQDGKVRVDIGLADGDVVAGWTAIHTPGHASDHLCYANAAGIVLSADHVMSWSTSVVSPPHGNMTHYFESLRKLLARPDDSMYLPGHGPPITRPHAFVRALLVHRTQREDAILAALASGPKTTMGIVSVLYANVDPRLHKMAERSVIAHLHKLRDEGRAQEAGEVWQAA